MIYRIPKYSNFSLASPKDLWSVRNLETSHLSFILKVLVVPIVGECFKKNQNSSYSFQVRRTWWMKAVGFGKRRACVLWGQELCWQSIGIKPIRKQLHNCRKRSAWVQTQMKKLRQENTNLSFWIHRTERKYVSAVISWCSI